MNLDGSDRDGDGGGVSGTYQLEAGGMRSRSTRNTDADETFGMLPKDTSERSGKELTLTLSQELFTDVKVGRSFKFVVAYFRFVFCSSNNF